MREPQPSDYDSLAEVTRLRRMGYDGLSAQSAEAAAAEARGEARGRLDASRAVLDYADLLAHSSGGIPAADVAWQLRMIVRNEPNQVPDAVVVGSADVRLRNLAEAEARGRRQQIDRLRDRGAYVAWLRGRTFTPDQGSNAVAADFLESQEGS